MKNVELRYKDGVLQVEYTVKQTPGDEETATVILQPASNTEAVIHGLGSGRGDTIKIIENDGERLARYSGFYYDGLNKVSL